MNGLTSEYDAWAEIGLHNTAAAAVYSECSSDHMVLLSVCVCVRLIAKSSILLEKLI